VRLRLLVYGIEIWWSAVHHTNVYTAGSGAWNTAAVSRNIGKVGLFRKPKTLVGFNKIAPRDVVNPVFFSARSRGYPLGLLKQLNTPPPLMRALEHYGRITFQKPTIAALYLAPVSEIAGFCAQDPHLHSTLILGVFPTLIRHEIIFDVFQSVWKNISFPECHRLTDRQRCTDGRATYCGISTLCIASHGKNVKKTFSKNVGFRSSSDTSTFSFYTVVHSTGSALSWPKPVGPTVGYSWTVDTWPYLSSLNICICSPCEYIHD